MPNIWNTLFDSRGYIPHGHCFLWKPDLVWLHVASDAVIAIAYFSIPVLLLYFIQKRKDLPFDWVFMLFGVFIIACGTGHLLDIWTIWHPAYYMSGVVKALTAAVSLFTAIELFSLIPKALSLPSPAQLEAANRELQDALNKLQQTQAQLIQTEKMSSLGQLVAGVAHEINNPVNFIYGNLSHIEHYSQSLFQVIDSYQRLLPEHSNYTDAVDNDELEFIQFDLPKILSSVRIGVERIRQIVTSLCNFSRFNESEMKSVNLHEGLDSTLLILQNRLKANSSQVGIQLQKQYGNLPLVECYASQLNQVFMNILSNAIDAIEQAHRPTSEPLTGPIGKITVQTCVVKPGWVQVQIADNGAGMSEEARQRIFDPFFTTKPVGKGTGLGLSISHEIVVEKHRGLIVCESIKGKGTTFSIQIPFLHTSRNLSVGVASS